VLSDCSFRVVPSSVVVLFEKVGRQRVDNHLVPTRSGADAISVVDSDEVSYRFVNAGTVNVLASFFGATTFCSFT
jgi:hypothetical protein